MLQLLHNLGAVVKGYSLTPEHPQDLYNQIEGDKLCYSSVTGDVRDLHNLTGELVRFQPDFVFHLAAQALVRRSYHEPVDTFATNTMGTVNVLEAIRHLEGPCVGLMITTDKVYENPERGQAFNEKDQLGGYDPYSASKAAAEIVIDSYRRSFFHPDTYATHQKAIASVRAGNVIGGGDWSDDRLIPDIVKAIQYGNAVTLRNPESVRPWQHVLEPLTAYLQLAVKMKEQGQHYSEAYNIGPEQNDMRTVAMVTNAFYTAFNKEPNITIAQDPNMHEAGLLMLDNTKLKTAIGWKPKLTADEAIQWTADWYADSRSAGEKCQEQMDLYDALTVNF